MHRARLKQGGTIEGMAGVIVSPRVLESRTNKSPVVLEYMDSVSGMFRARPILSHSHASVMHALGSRLWGFTQELFNDSQSSPVDMPPEMLQMMGWSLARR
jgi:hypothetical protein